MLWFNTSIISHASGGKVISIHLMLWFNFLLREFGMSDISFQYILCYGSTFRLLIVLKEFKGFQYILCYGSTNPTYFLKSSKILISIHLMLWFNNNRKVPVPKPPQISIHLMLWFNHCWYVIAIFYYTEVLLK